MANEDTPNGAAAVDILSGGVITHKTRKYNVDASNATAIFPGDFVIMEADGNVAPAVAAVDLLGVCAGVQVTNSDAAAPDDFLSSGNLNETEHPGFLPALTAGVILVIDDPQAIYEIQTDGTLASTAAGSNAEIVAGAGSTVTGRSAHELSSTVIAGTAQLRLIEPSTRIGNDLSSANSKWYVKINEHFYNEGAGVA